ncbi:MAG TPA: ATP-binding protein [Pyrinomonadaceae bacterium]|jgi:signal transduction histidine kinase/ActR/RegA family two-component response regulator
MTTPELRDNRDERILILAPTGRDAALTAQVVGEAGLAAEVCGHIEELCSKMLAGAGLAFITGEVLTQTATQCLVEGLARQPTWADIPILVLTSGGGQSPENAETLATLGGAGNVTLIERPVRVTTLISAFRAALRARRRQYDVRDYLLAERRAKEALAESEERLRVALDSERAARTEAEAASRLKDEFLATVSHELRTPLTAVLGWAHLLRAGGQLADAEREHALEVIERNARSQNQLIEDLLDVSRIITGKLRLDVRPVEPVSFIEAAIEAVVPAAEAKGILIHRSLNAGVPEVSGDPARLQQVVWNLLSNAIKFTPRGGRVEVRLERTNSHLEISVTDSGAGIEAEFLPYVFDRFRQADGSTRRQHGGLGLGLAIVRHLVELHGGSVGAASPGEGLGATFTVRLPLMSVSRHEAEDARSSVGPRGPALAVEWPDRIEGLKILVVDDEADTLELLKLSLEQCGAQITTATSSSEALSVLAEERPDVIVSDIGMPFEDGYEFIRKVRALPAESGGRIPAIALTAYATVQDRLRVLRSGYQMHVAKPVELGELTAIVSSVAGRR